MSLVLVLAIVGVILGGIGAIAGAWWIWQQLHPPEQPQPADDSSASSPSTTVIVVIVLTVLAAIAITGGLAYDSRVGTGTDPTPTPIPPTEVWFGDLPPQPGCGAILEGGSRGVPQGQPGTSNPPWVYVVGVPSNGTQFLIMSHAVVDADGTWETPATFEPCSETERKRWTICAIVSNEVREPGITGRKPVGVAISCVEIMVGGPADEPTPTPDATPTVPSTPTTLPPLPTAAARIDLEAESGSGQGVISQRSEASGGRTVWFHDGESRFLSFALADGGRYVVRVRYSNDNAGPLETIAVQVDGESAGEFSAEDTGDFGIGWNIFRWGGLSGSIELSPGTHEVKISVLGGDGSGVEIDLVSLEILR